MSTIEVRLTNEADKPPLTNVLDHIVHLCPPGSLEDSCRHFTALGFNVLPGGTHSDGLTYNALIVLGSGIYIEFISFTHPTAYYPPGSDERRAREAHRWANKAPGWIDFAFLGNGSKENQISEVVNARARREGLEKLYQAETEGGRIRPDDIELKWLITAPYEDGLLPFFCGDVTSRTLRVPMSPASNTKHQSTALDIFKIDVAVSRSRFESLARQFRCTLGVSATQESNAVVSFPLSSPTGPVGSRHLVLRACDDGESGNDMIVSVSFLAVKVAGPREVGTPYSRLQWHQLENR